MNYCRTTITYKKRKYIPMLESWEEGSHLLFLQVICTIHFQSSIRRLKYVQGREHFFLFSLFHHLSNFSPIYASLYCKIAVILYLPIRKYEPRLPRKPSIYYNTRTTDRFAVGRPITALQQITTTVANIIREFLLSAKSALVARPSYSIIYILLPHRVRPNTLAKPDKCINA